MTRNNKGRKSPRDENLSSWHQALTSSPCHCEDSPDCPVLSSGLLLEALYEISLGSRGARQSPEFCWAYWKEKKPINIRAHLSASPTPPPPPWPEWRSAQHRAGFGQGLDQLWGSSCWPLTGSALLSTGSVLYSPLLTLCTPTNPQAGCEATHGRVLALDSPSVQFPILASGHGGPPLSDPLEPSATSQLLTSFKEPPFKSGLGSSLELAVFHLGMPFPCSLLICLSPPFTSQPTWHLLQDFSDHSSLSSTSRILGYLFSQ